MFYLLNTLRFGFWGDILSNFMYFGSIGFDQTIDFVFDTVCLLRNFPPKFFQSPLDFREWEIRFMEHSLVTQKS
jgi:hypothetical protein